MLQLSAPSPTAPTGSSTSKTELNYWQVVPGPHRVLLLLGCSELGSSSLDTSACPTTPHRSPLLLMPRESCTEHSLLIGSPREEETGERRYLPLLHPAQLRPSPTALRGSAPSPAPQGLSTLHRQPALPSAPPAKGTGTDLALFPATHIAHQTGLSLGGSQSHRGSQNPKGEPQSPQPAEGNTDQPVPGAAPLAFLPKRESGELGAG